MAHLFFQSRSRIRHLLSPWLLAGALVLSNEVPSLFAAETPAEAAGAKPELVVYVYDSLMAKGGLGPDIFPIFEAKCGCKVKALASGDGAQLLSRLQLDAERGKPTAQVVLGLDQNLWDRAQPLVETWGKWRPKNFERVSPTIQVGTPADGFLPFDYGVFSFISDRQALKELKLEAPRKLSDLLTPKWKRNLILEDPRTSTPGLSFVLFTREVLKSGAVPAFADFWQQFRSQWLTLAPGWDGAYGLFLKKQAPLVWSYTTSQAYHQENGDREGRYQAVVLEEGAPTQIEGAALVKGALNAPGARDRARGFLEFLLSEEVQKRIPLRNWMLPAVSGTAIPDSFKKLPQPKRLVAAPLSKSESEKLLSAWSQAVEGSARK